MKLSTALLLIIVCTFSTGPKADTQDEGPVPVIIKTTDRIFAELDGNLATYEANPDALKTLVRKDLLPMLDVHYSARLILGRAGRGVEQEKIDEFADAMINLLVNRYADGLLRFRSQQQLLVLPQRGELNESLTQVRTRIRLDGGGEAPIDYAFHKTDEGWKAFDVIVEGISYVSTYRNQIMPEVQANGIDSVIARLQAGDLELAE